MGRVRMSAVVLAIVVIGSLMSCSFGTHFLPAIRGMQRLVGINEDFDYAVGAAAGGSHAYVLDLRQDGMLPVIKAVDLSVPATPTVVGTVALPSAGSASANCTLALEGSHLYVAAGDLFIIDVTNPADPVILGSYSSIEPCKEIALDVDSGIAVLSPGFQLVDVSNPGSIVALGSLSDLGDDAGWGLAIDGDMVFAVDAGNICVVDISDPTNPTKVNGEGFSATNAYADVSFPEPNTLIAVGPLQGLDILDTTNPTSLSVISHLDGDYYWVDDSPWGTVFRGIPVEVKRLCVGFVDLFDLEHPRTTGNYSVPSALGGLAWALAVAGGYVVVPYFDLGIAVFSR